MKLPIIMSPEVIAELSDHDLLFTYQRTIREPGDPAADVLLAEIERRGLDV